MHAIAALNVIHRAAVSNTFAYPKVYALPATLRRSCMNIRIFLPFGDHMAGNAIAGLNNFQHKLS
jgi:hypothetical protein